GTIGCRGWIDNNIVHPAFGRHVIVAARAAGHVLRRGAERRKMGRVKRERRIGPVEILRRYTQGDPAWDEGILRRSETQPQRVEKASRVGQAVVPFGLHAVQVVRFSTRDWHITL